MKKRISFELPWFLALISLVALFFARPALAGDSVCAQVKIQIDQELTLERQAFDAHMRINNGLTGITLENVDVDVSFADEHGNSVRASFDPNDTDALFFIRLDSMTNINDVDGGGTVAPSTSADIHWLIIPAPGASNGLESGTLYYVGATLTYTIGGEEHTTVVNPDYIFVKPMPELTLDYFLPTDVYGDDAFTSQIEPSIPFALGVRVLNSGAGTAHELKIDSAQPKIIENDQGLLISFVIIGSEVNGKPATTSLLADFGDIRPNSAGLARWIMECSLSGKFVEFTATYSHSDELGGELTSLIDAVNTHFLVRDVLVDLAGRDSVRDFLAKDGGVYKVYESDTVDTSVLNQSASSTLQFVSQSGVEAKYTLSTPVTAGFMYVQLSDPFNGQKVLKSITRSDGKQIRPENVWLSKTRQGDSEWQYFFNLFDVNTTNAYTVIFEDLSASPQPPVLQFIPDRSRGEGQQLSFIVEASDPNATIPKLSASPLPAGATFIDQGNTGNGIATGVFDWTPAIGQSGQYVLTFGASDGQLTDSQRVTLTINTVDTIAPDTSITNKPANPSNSKNATFNFSSTEPDSTFQCRLDSGAYAGCTSPKSYTGLSDGSHTFNVMATDAAGNLDATAASYTWTVDTIPPGAPIVSGTTPTENPRPTWTWTNSGGDGNGTYRYKLDNNDLSTGATETTATTYTPASDLPVGTYTLYVQERDAACNWSVSGSKAIIVTAPNMPPVAQAGPDQNVFTGIAVTLDGSGSSDPEGDLITFAWSFDAVPPDSLVTDASLSDKTSAKPIFTPDVDGVFKLHLTVNDGIIDSTPDEVIIIAATPNVAPNANAGPDQNVITGAPVFLDGSGSNDPDNGPNALSYMWDFFSLPAASTLSNTDIDDNNKAWASFIPDVNGTYLVRLSVSDGELSSNAVVNIVSSTLNVPPNANAGDDLTINLGETASLNGSESYDPNNGPSPLSYAWQFVSVPGGSLLGNQDIREAGSAFPTFIPDTAGTYVLELMVSDGADATYDNVAVTVKEKSYVISGGAYNYPQTATYKATFSLEVRGPASPSGWLKYYYARTRMNFVSTGITSVSVSGNTATIEGTGTVNNTGGYTFTAIVTDGSPDKFGITIKKPDGSLYYSASPINISGGDLLIKTQ